MTRSNRPSRVDGFFDWAKNNRVVSVFVIAGLVLVSVAKVWDAAYTVSAWESPKKGLALASETAKGESARDLSRAAFRRLFWMRSVVARLKLGAPESDVQEAWRNYMAASEAWNVDLLNNIQFVRRYYPNTGKADSLENEIQASFGSIADSLNDLRYHRSEWSPEEQRAQLAADSAALEVLNHLLYIYMAGFEPPTSR